ncbi:VOC family protein [Hyalangium versicolor]|uniref:VOC family protein n=1 Tax=Hyalangium versicolor TaxID=2861190 RepID=UPI001CCE7902|nr:VOC family protein [Hyalangium versicolor]
MTQSKQATVRAQPLIAVRDVKASSAWYKALLEVESSGDPDHPHRLMYDRLMSGDTLILQIHRWDDEEHPNLTQRDNVPAGHGVLVWFEVDDFDAAVERARKLRATVVEEPHVNPAPQHREMWLRDPDGYYVVLASRDGEAA